MLAALLARGAQAEDQQPDASPGGPVAALIGGEVSPLGSYLAGRFAQEVGDLGAATELIGLTLKNDPDNPELLQREFVLQLSEGRYDEALDIAHRLERIDDGVRSVGTFLSAEALKAGDYAAADDYATKVDPGGANRFVTPILKAWAQIGAGDLDGALAALKPLDRFEGFSALYYMQRGLIYDLGGKPLEAEQDLVKALAVAGDPPLRLVQALGNLYARTGRPDEARATYQRFLDQNPDSDLLEADLAALQAGKPPAPLIGAARDGLGEAMFGLASVLVREQAADIALLFDRLALDLRPDFGLAQLLLGDILRQQQRLPEAIAAYRAVPAGTPYAWGARLSIADCLDQEGRTDEAEAMLRAMIDERPDRSDAATILGNLLRSKERFADAAAAYDVAVARLKEPRQRHWSLFYFRGIAYERSNQWPKAEADFKEALELEPDQPFVLNYLAYSWIEKGEHYDEALDMLRKAVDQRPNDGYIVDSLGWVLYRLGRYQEAVAQLERAVGLKPLDPVLNDHLGDAYWRVGRKREARFQWQRALQFKPEPDQVGLIAAKLAHGLATSETPDSGG
ncbi:MAG: tetratricopeptide repeat protein [Rhodospirillaceae bacterium]|nr:tetratricopeptide repeat protein [Rhodospirillaceae bacterium]